MRAIQVVSTVYVESSGPSYSVPALCHVLKTNGVDVVMHTREPAPDAIYDFPAYFHRNSRLFAFMEGSPDMAVAIASDCKSADIVHSNGAWMLPHVYAALGARGTNCKVVTSPHGSFSPWALNRSHWKKKIFGFFFQYAAFRATDMWHVTCEKEYEEIRALGYRQPVAIVPIGIDLPEIEPRNTRNTRKRVVFFGRLHKVKAIDNLILAWEKVCSQPAPGSSVCSAVRDWELVIAGPDGGVRGDLESMVADRRIPGVSFVGEINGPAKYRFLADADIYVLPSHTENFGVTVAEALACGVPSIVSQCAPWQGLEREKCGFWVDNGVESLADALKRMMSMSDSERAAMGARGQEWMKRDFAWEGIGRKMKAAYEWLIGQGEKPELVVSC